ncbi:hypothetical protein HanIR_Chr08g0370301 [Helianthus annuus]|nr:hypothetical protein HanIR_Chr08g0370301 [Helianthus annuus]
MWLTLPNGMGRREGFGLVLSVGNPRSLLGFIFILFTILFVMIYLERFIREITYLGITCLFKISFIYKFTYLTGDHSTLGRRCIFSESLESGMELTPTISFPSNQSSSFLTIYLCKYQEGFLGEGLGLG